MIRLSEKDNDLIVDSDVGDLAPRNESQLTYWGFRPGDIGLRFVATASDTTELATKVSSYFARCDLPCEVQQSIQDMLEQNKLVKQSLELSLAYGVQLKKGDLSNSEAPKFLKFLNGNIPRKLKDHQLKSALHLLAVKNGANFSVPGSGKTTVVLSAFQMLRAQDVVDALFVVGPPACFGPWRNEYEEVLGGAPSFEVFAGGNIEDRHSRYLADINSVRDIYLTSFQTLHRDWDQVRILFSRQGIRFFFVVDEAHYIKQLDGAWAIAALRVARFATRRCILTGTPFPKSYSDAFNLFDFLWPESPPISSNDKRRIALLTKRKEYDGASEILQESVGPLFYRVRKSDLGLAQQVFHEPTLIQMNVNEKRIYDTILDKIRIVSKDDYFRDLEIVLRLRRGRMMRLRQCLSYANLLSSALDGYEENLYEDNQSLAKLIHDYDEIEKPSKLEALLVIVSDLHAKGEKVVVWSNFVKTLEMIRDALKGLRYGVHLIYGATPLEKSEDIGEEVTRERCIREFNSPDSGINVLVANPAACAESISLHKLCSNAIYYDLSYNCAQYLQSLDRIHRVGGSETKKSYYHFLQYEKTLDQDILANVRGKAERMSQIIDQDYPIYSLDMFNEDDELAAYNRLFGSDS